jgi:hypothetical protein
LSSPDDDLVTLAPMTLSGRSSLDHMDLRVDSNQQSMKRSLILAVSVVMMFAVQVVGAEAQSKPKAMSGSSVPTSPSAWTASCHSARNISEPSSARSWITITRNDRTRVWATYSSRRRLHYADRVQCCRERLGGVLKFYYRQAASPIGQVFAHDGVIIGGPFTPHNLSRTSLAVRDETAAAVANTRAEHYRVPE